MGNMKLWGIMLSSSDSLLVQRLSIMQDSSNLKPAPTSDFTNLFTGRNLLSLALAVKENREKTFTYERAYGCTRDIHAGAPRAEASLNK